MLLHEVLVHGSAEATELLKQYCSKQFYPHIYAPHIEETIDVTSNLCAYKVNVGFLCFLTRKIVICILSLFLNDRKLCTSLFHLWFLFASFCLVIGATY